jgi:hypothetical protein
MALSDRALDSVAEEICSMLGQGIVLEPGVMDYIDSTFSNPSWSEFQQIFREASDCELDSLLELIFFPNEAMQIQLEARLEACRLYKEDEEGLIAYIRQKLPSVQLFSPSRSKSTTIDAPEWAIAQLVQRLNIDKSHHPRVLKTIDRFIPAKLQDRLKVCLRNKQKPFSDGQMTFLCIFIEKNTPEKYDFWEVFQFLVGFLDEIENDADLFAALVESKRSCIECLQNVTRLEAQLAKSNMETMLMQGIRIPYIDKEAARQKLEMIDNICYTVFGKIMDFGEMTMV